MNKLSLREEYLQKRDKLDEQTLRLKDEQIKNQFIAYFNDLKIEVIHTFLPMVDKKEINTQPILNSLRHKNPKLKVVVSKSNLKTFEMTSYLLQKDTVLEVNRWGIPDTTAGVEYDDINIDVILIPLVIFYKSVQRVGYGKGFYDRFLKKLRPGALKIGLCIDPAIPIITDTHEMDVTLNYCVTPERVYQFC